MLSVGDKMKRESDKSVKYTYIAIKGLLFGYGPRALQIDGETVTGVISYTASVAE